MKIKYLKLKNWLYVALGGMLGINLSCDKTPPLACEYGVPEATYTIKGKVTDSNQHPVAGIEVRISNNSFDNNDYSYSNETLTDDNGRYEISTYQFPNIDTMYVQFRDIDSTANGHYADTVVTVLFKDAEFSGASGNWNYGSATVTKDVQLRKIE